MDESNYRLVLTQTKLNPLKKPGDSFKVAGTIQRLNKEIESSQTNFMHAF